MKLEPDLREFIELLNARDVRYVIVGAFALAYHGRPRYTGDIDFFVECSAHNAELLSQVLEQFGFTNIGVAKEDFTTPDQVVQLGVEPHRMDLMTSISGVAFEEAWNTREYGDLDGLQVPYISRELLKRNKAAVGRKQDLADLDYL
ncbi:MAG: nucleotidyltransferase [bacterium]